MKPMPIKRLLFDFIFLELNASFWQAKIGKGFDSGMDLNSSSESSPKP